MACDDDLQKQADNFNQLCETDWSSYVSSGALTTLHVKKRNKTQSLPLTEDIKRLSSHLAHKRKVFLDELKSTPTVDNWHNLAKVSLANIILFNRRRSGEASRVLVLVEIWTVTKDVEGVEVSAVEEAAATGVKVMALPDEEAMALFEVAGMALPDVEAMALPPEAVEKGTIQYYNLCHS